MDFLIDEIGVDSYFFHYFLNVCVVQNRLLRLSKGLFREKYSNKYFIFEASFEYQSFKLTAELNLSREEFFLFSKLWNWSNNISKSLFIPYSIPKFETISLQSCLFLHFNDFQSSKSCLFRFGVRLPEICFKKNSSTSSYHLKFTSKSKILTTYWNISTFYLITYHKFN